MPSCEEAACCMVEVVKGAGGDLATVLAFTCCTCTQRVRFSKRAGFADAAAWFPFACAHRSWHNQVRSTVVAARGLGFNLWVAILGKKRFVCVCKLVCAWSA